MKKILAVGLFFLVTGLTYGQSETSPEGNAVKKFLARTHMAYQQSEKLSFRVHYRYANKKEPGKYIDTLSGEIFIDKNRMRYVLDGVETIITSKYTIRIMDDEKLIYLSGASRTGMIDPVTILDSLLTKVEGGKASFTSSKQSSTLSIQFPAGDLYNSMAITTDAKTGFFENVIYDLKTGNLVGDELIDQPGRPAPYQSEGRIEIIFSQYQHGQFDDSLFDDTQYITRQGSQFEPSGRYSGYRVFVASLNL